MAIEFMRDIDDVRAILCEEGMCKQKTRERLVKQASITWSTLEDLALRKNDRTSKQYRHIVKTKGQDAIDNRKKFLRV